VPNYSQELDGLFHALADPSRREIVEQLSRGPASVSELARPLTMSLPAVVQHLQVLESSGLIRTEKVGRVRTCHLQLKRLDTADNWIRARHAEWERRLDRLGDYLAATDPDPSAPMPSASTSSSTSSAPSDSGPSDFGPSETTVKGTKP
jgi:DNA-binding transcriptional ArsR family regulator